MKTRKIPDRIIRVILAAAILSIPFFPEISLKERGIGFLCVSLPLLAVNLLSPGAFGGGDIKLTAVSGFLLGWQREVAAFLYALFLAGVYALWLLAGKRKGRKSRFALGPFLCLGVLIVLIFTP